MSHPVCDVRPSGAHARDDRGGARVCVVCRGKWKGEEEGGRDSKQDVGGDGEEGIDNTPFTSIFTLRGRGGWKHGVLPRQDEGIQNANFVILVSCCTYLKVILGSLANNVELAKKLFAAESRLKMDEPFFPQMRCYVAPVNGRLPSGAAVGKAVILNPPLISCHFPYLSVHSSF